VHTYDVALRRKEKTENGQWRRKRPEARKSPQTVEEEREGTRPLFSTREAQEPYSAPCGRGSSVAELPRSLIRRSSANRVSAKFRIFLFHDVRGE
jgi:hypothetical protein